MKRWLAIALLSGSAFAQVQLGRNVQIGAGGTGPTLDVQTNGVDNLSQTLLDLDQGNNMVITNTSGGHVRFDAANASSQIQQQVIPPSPGQYVLVYPDSVVASGLARATAVTTPGSIGAKLSFTIGCGGLAPCTGTFTWTGFTLPSYVLPANVTAIYPFAVYSGGSITSGNAVVSPAGGLGINSDIHSLMHQVTGSTGMTGAQVSGSSVQMNFLRTLVVAAGENPNINIASVGYIVYYTGTAPPTNTDIIVDPPLFFNGTSFDLGIDPMAIGNLQPLYIVGLPAASNASGYIYQVIDGASSSDCTTGGGSTVNLCRSNGSAWSIFTSGGGGGGLSGQTTGYLPLATSATASTVSSALQDTGSSLVYHGTGTAHGVTLPEGTAISALAGSDILYADATAHCIQYSANGGAFGCLGSGTTSLPAGNGFYTFYVSAGTTFARNNNTGAVDYSGTDAGAVIRSALTNASGTCGTLNFQPGTYNINSLAVDPHVATNFLAISIPNAAGTNQYCEWSVIGDGVPPIMDQFSTPVQTAGVVFNVTSTALSGLTAGQYAIGIGMQAPASGVLGNSLIIKNVDVRFPTNQLAGTYTIGEIDASNAENFTIENSLVDINIAQASIVPATAGFTGIKATNSSHEENRIGRTYSVGAYTGFDLSTEHVTMSDSYALNCVNAIDYGNHSGAGNLYDPSVFINSGWATCQHGLTIGTQVQTGALLDMTGLAFEEAATGSFVPVYRAKEINNGSTFGSISFTRVTEGVGLSPLANLFDGGGGSGFCKVNSGGPTGACGAGSFSALAGGTNTTAAMLVGSGASLAPTGTGTIQATNIASTLSAGTGIAITGSGTTASPYAIAATGGSSVATVASSETVASSATPTFSTSFNVSYNVLTANVTTFTLAAGSDGQAKTLTFCQNGTGGFTVTPPANVHGFFTVGATASKCSSQHFNYSTAQTAWLADSAGVINE